VLYTHQNTGSFKISDNNADIIKNNTNYHEISIDNNSNSGMDSGEDKEDSAEYEIDEKSDIIIDKRIKYFLM